MREMFQPIRIPPRALAVVAEAAARELVSQGVARCVEKPCGAASASGQNATPSAAVGSQSAPAKRSDNVARAQRLAPRQLTAAELLLAGCTVATTARKLNVNPRTVFRWLNDARFAREVDRRADLAERFRRAHRSLQRGSAQVAQSCRETS